MYILSLTYVRYGKKIAYDKFISRMYPQAGVLGSVCLHMSQRVCGGVRPAKSSFYNCFALMKLVLTFWNSLKSLFHVKETIYQYD